MGRAQVLAAHLPVFGERAHTGTDRSGEQTHVVDPPRIARRRVVGETEPAVLRLPAEVEALEHLLTLWAEDPERVAVAGGAKAVVGGVAADAGAPQHLLLALRDGVAKRTGLGVARRQRLGELAAKAEGTRVEHHRVGVGEDSVRVG